MNLKSRIQLMSILGEEILQRPEWLSEAVARAENENRWFTTDNSWQALNAIARSFLDQGVLSDWVAQYDVADSVESKNVGLVLAGNIPLVGFHDVLAVFMAGHHAMVKLSSKDESLMKAIYKRLLELDPDVAEHISIVGKLQNLEAVIATGSNNTSTHFEQYFAKYPNIIRGNRHAVAVLSGSESTEDFVNLGQDIFNYFGLGCRNISKIYVPTGYKFDDMLGSLHEHHKELVNHNKYKNNFDYNNALLMLNRVPYLMSGSLIITESKDISSRIATLHYEYYDDVATVVADISARSEEIQVVVSDIDLSPLSTVGYGAAQRPSIMDYADGVDTMQFLTSLYV